MRPSPLRHPVAVLRGILKIGQAEFGKICGCSARTIQAVELKKLALSESLATRISTATGVSVAWLLDGDPSAPPVTETPSSIIAPRRPYTFDLYEKYCALKESERRFSTTKRNYTVTFVEKKDYEPGQERDLEILSLCKRVLAQTEADERGHVIRWRLERMLELLADEIDVKP
jgi:transcriptional regulator with XRE-family HTH domain